MTDLTAATYKPMAYGQITKLEAGIIYRANKEGKIKTRAPFVGLMYDEAKNHLRFATERYNQESRFYDRTYRLVKAILADDLETAQELVEAIETDRINRAPSKSVWARYQQ